jgi:hypothetical protein
MEELFRNKKLINNYREKFFYRILKWKSMGLYISGMIVSIRDIMSGDTGALRTMDIFVHQQI